MKRRTFNAGFKAKVVLEMLRGEKELTSYIRTARPGVRDSFQSSLKSKVCQLAD